MRKPSQQEKELAIALAKIVNKVVPELVEKAGASTFEISLEKDEHGVGITVELDYKEDMIHRGLTPEEMKETWGAVASKALKDNNGDIKKAARQLGISVDEFRHTMTMYNI